MPHPSASRASLARSTLINMGVRIAGIVLVATLFSYFHMLHTLRVEALAQLERHVLERSQREEGIFVLAEDTHAVLKRALAERYEHWRQQAPQPHFDRLFARLPDGTLRNQPQGFDGTRMPGVFVPSGVTTDEDFQRWLLAAYDVLAQYGPAFHVRFTNTYVTLPGGAIAIYWPESPTWCQDAAPDFVSSQFDFFTISTPENNPQRQIAWTAIFSDPVAKTSMVSVSTPVDRDGRHTATISHDILLGELKARTLNDNLPGAYNLLFRDDGQLIAHPEMMEQPGTDPHLRLLIERVMSRPTGQTVLELPEHDEYIAVARMKGTGWNFVTVLPEHVVSQPAFRAARFILLLGIMSLLLELAIMSWVLKQQITQPLLAFTQATDKVAAGDFKVELDTSRDDELGQLTRAFRLMADEVQRREEALRQANLGLEQRVEERTRELQAKNEELGRAMKQLRDTQKQLVVQERLASLGTLTAGIAHELKNPLHFVNNFAQLSSRFADELTESLDSQRARLDPAVLAEVDEVLTELRQNMTKIRDHGNRANQIINGMLLHARESSGPRELADLNEVLRKGIHLGYHGSRARAPGFELNIQTDFDPQVKQVELVVPEILRVLVNVVDNACYSLQQKKRTLGDPFSPRLDVRTRDMGERVEVRIRDNGTGIPNELLDKVFNPFLTTKPTGVGTGLGLSISHDIIVGHHHGDIRLESVEGEFTELILELPKRAPVG
jgi:signal transduction histidine kinase